MDKLFYFNKKKIVYKNIYYFYFKKENNVNISYKYLIRMYYFFKLINFFKRNGFNKNLSLKIFLNNYYYIWLLFLQNYNLKYYYLLLKKIIIKYNYITTNNYTNLITFNNLSTPNSFINYNNINNTENIKIDFKKFNLFLKNKNNNIININNFLNFNNNNFTIHFIRVQRRYNKRRYSKVRVVSRPSFFAGISLSSIMVAILWNGSIKSVDWLTAWIITIDINLILIILLLYYLYRIYRIYYLNIFVRKRGKVKIINSLNLLLTNYLLKYLFK